MHPSFAKIVLVPFDYHICFDGGQKKPALSQVEISRQILFDFKVTGQEILNRTLSRNHTSTTSHAGISQSIFFDFKVAGKDILSRILRRNHIAGISFGIIVARKIFFNIIVARQASSDIIVTWLESIRANAAMQTSFDAHVARDITAEVHMKEFRAPAELSFDVGVEEEITQAIKNKRDVLQYVGCSQGRNFTFQGRMVK